MTDDKARRFAALLEPHLDAAYNLARWLTRDASDASDVVQEACLRAFRHFDGYRGGQARAWLLRIVRNTAYSWLQKQHGGLGLEYNGDLSGLVLGEEAQRQAESLDPEQAVLRLDDMNRLQAALLQLPPEYREVLVLRELEELSYREIADVIELPMGTVMSRLHRARVQLRVLLAGEGPAA